MNERNVYLSPSREQMSPITDLLPTQWLHSSVGIENCTCIAELMGSNPVAATRIFQVSITSTLNNFHVVYRKREIKGNFE